MYNGSNDSFNFKPHELTLIIPFGITFGLAWQFNYQKSKQKNVPTKFVGTQNLLLLRALIVDAD